MWETEGNVPMWMQAFSSQMQHSLSVMLRLLLLVLTVIILTVMTFLWQAMFYIHFHRLLLWLQQFLIAFISFDLKCQHWNYFPSFCKPPLSISSQKSSKCITISWRYTLIDLLVNGGLCSALWNYHSVFHLIIQYILGEWQLRVQRLIKNPLLRHRQQAKKIRHGSGVESASFGQLEKIHQNVSPNFWCLSIWNSSLFSLKFL